MADRTASVTLRANISQYLSAMKQAAAAPGQVSAEAQRSFQRLGGQMQSAGRAATLGITTPLVAAGGAAVHMAATFDGAFGRMVGLAGVPQAEIDALKESVLELAGETATGPNELAEALYFLRSSGLDADQAMQALEQSAMASAAGMGDTAAIADAVSSAMNAYAASGLSAAEATDILVATARAGKAEPTELAGALGRVLPIASELGITFEDVGGALAALSLTGNDASTSATLLSNIMSKLLKPSQQGAEALAAVGLSTDSIRQSIADQGLLATLEMLKGKLGDSGFVRFLEDAQAVQGALTLVGDESGTVAGAFDIVADHAGATGEAFSAMADTDAHKIKQGLVDVQTAMVELGTILLPIAADIASGIADVAKWFSDLPAPIQTAVVAVGALAAAAGPLLFAGGSIVKNWALVSSTLTRTSGALGTFSKSLGAVGLVAGTAYAAWQILGEGNLNTSAHINTASTALQTETVAAYNAAVAAGEATTSVDALAIAHVALSNAIAAAAAEADSGLVESMSALNVSSDEYLDTLLAFSGTNVSTPMAENAEAIRLTERYFGLAAGEGRIFLEVMYSDAASVSELANIIGATEAEVEAFAGAIQDVSTYATENQHEVDALALTYLDSQAAMGGASREALLVAESIAGSRREAGNATDVYLEYVKQVLLLAPAERDAVMATDGFASSINELIPGLEDAGGAMAELEDVAASTIDTLTRQQENWAFSNVLIGAFSDALDQALGTSRNWVRTHDDFAGALLTFNEQIEDASAGLDYNTEAGLANREALFDMADGVIALTEANIESGKSHEEVTAEYDKAREALVAAATAAGLDETAVRDLLAAYGLTPELLVTTAELRGTALQQWRVERYLEKLDTVPQNVATLVEALIDQGKVDEAIAVLDSIPDEDVAVTPYLTTAHLNVAIGYSYPGGGPPGGLRDHALGGYATTPRLAVWGHGPEVILPLTNQPAMSSLLARPEIGPAVAAAMPIAPSLNVTVPVTGGGGGDNYYINVTNHGRREITQRDLANAIRDAKAMS